MEEHLKRPLRGLNLKGPEDEVKDFCEREIERAELSDSGLTRARIEEAGALLLRTMAEIREEKRS